MCSNIFFWNVRGLNDSDKHQPFSSWLRCHNPTFGAILETHIKEQNLNLLMSKLCPGWSFFSNHLSDTDGRIILIWKPPAVVRVLHQTNQEITCEISLSVSARFVYTAIYASNSSAERSDLWVDLINTHHALSLDSTPWMVGGDLNQITHPMEHSSLDVNVFTADMIELRDCLSQLGLFDLRFQGPPFTWINNQPLSPVAKKLDRTLVNTHLLNLFPNSLATFLPQLTSDHTPCLVNLNLPRVLDGTRPFKFPNYLTKHPDFHSVLYESWIKAGSACQNLTSLCWKQRLIKKELKQLNRENFSQIQKRVCEAYSLLQLVQVQTLQTPTTATILQEKELHEKWNFLRHIEECYFRQKSRVNWLKEGDLNTAYFFRTCRSRANYNSIVSFLLSTGVAITDPRDMSAHAVNHFQSILGPDVLAPLQIQSPVEWFQNLFPFRTSHAQQRTMEMVPSVEEITTTLFKINPSKAPGPDGLTSGFYREAWSTVGLEVTTAITEFFASCFMPATTNATILALIPKRPGASKITDYRPVSCLNTLYKTVSRLLVRKLKPILPALILPNQTAFVKDRLLVENTVLAGELVNGYHKKQLPKRLTIKVDIAKAFDSVSWEFILNCLQSLQLPAQFLSWIKACICTTNFTVGYNGSVHGYFKGKRGLRQGDPLSPYLFVIAMNCLSHMLNKAGQEGELGYHHNCQKSQLTHLCFADDLLIFTEGSIHSVQCVLKILREFELRSGLAVSVQKSSFFAAGLTQEECQLISFSTGMPHESLPVRYLGVPLCTKKLSLANCEVLIQQVKSKVTSWSSRSLSFAGRLLLIKTVVTGITTFWCSSFILPKACIRRINSMCGAFLWKGNLEGHNGARVSWETVTRTKQGGGLGVKDLSTWNKACCLKLIWLLFFQSGSVWVAWFKNEVLNGSLGNFWFVKPHKKWSWLVNKLIKLREVVYPWIRLAIGNGRTCNFWTDHWSPFGRLETFLSAPGNGFIGIPKRIKLNSLVTNGRWNLPPARSEEQLQLHAYLTTVDLLEEKEDHHEWVLNGTRGLKYHMGEVYRELRGEEFEVPWWKVIWNTGGIPRHSFLAWLFTLDRCPTKDRLLSWGLNVDAKCLLCNVADESRNHLLFDCCFSWNIWRSVAGRVSLVPARDWENTLIQMQNLHCGILLRRLTLLSWQSTIYWIWNERNARMHRNAYKSGDLIISLIDRQVRDKINALRSSNTTLASKLAQLWFSTA